MASRRGLARPSGAAVPRAAAGTGARRRPAWGMLAYGPGDAPYTVVSRATFRERGAREVSLGSGGAAATDSEAAGREPKSDRVRRLPIRRARLASRAVVAVLLGLGFGGLLFVPSTWYGWTADILLRTWLAFLGTVMAHEAVHGLVGATRRGNAFWGRLALLPCMVPFTNFRGTHLLHHAHTNEPGKDPDLFLRPRRLWRLPFRAVAMPHQWFFWLRREGRLAPGHARDLVGNYLLIAACYLPVLLAVGPARLVFGMAPVCILTSLLLWIPFAHLTHEGYSTGPAEERSHNYYGRAAYWFSLGLSMHREHHLRPHLSWLELRQFVKPDPKRRLLPRRDVRKAQAAAAA